MTKIVRGFACGIVLLMVAGAVFAQAVKVDSAIPEDSKTSGVSGNLNSNCLTFSSYD